MCLPRGAVGWPMVCDCGISWSYSLFVKPLALTLLIHYTGLDKQISERIIFFLKTCASVLKYLIVPNF